MKMTLGSLFDGSGGFPLAGALCGVEPRWASEIEPYPIAVTRSRFPNMKHLGSITDIDGSKVEPVDIITFGSPCQDLSVAGKRAGLKHEANGDDETTRSGLFMEAVRIIKQMREATNGEYPQFCIWENVPGAFSSNKGEDFRTVLAELIAIVEPNAFVPPVPKAGWAYADSFVGDGWSLAYRVFDAQYWGVPQRRRRIHLVLDLRGERAREVLFEREGVRGYFAQGRTPWQGTTADAQNCAGTADREGTEPTVGGMDRGASGRSGEGKGNCGGLDAVAYTLKIRFGCEGGGKGALVHTDKSATPATNNDQYLFQPVPNLLLDDQGGQQINVRTDDVSPTLRAETHGNLPCVVQAACFKAGNGPKAHGIGYEEEVSPTLQAAPSGTNQAPSVCIEKIIYESHPMDSRIKEAGDVSPTVSVKWHKGAADTPLVVEPQTVTFAMQAIGEYKESDVSSSLKQRDYKDATDLVCGIDCRNMNEYPELYPTLQAKPNGGQSLNFSGAVRVYYIVRRLTPTECARLQGFADRWGDIDVKDSFTPNEYRFWLEVRNTHAAINGKQVKEYTEAQMLKWYNGLHTDSAEYKLWGNGIALPPALYCMQGIADALSVIERTPEDATVDSTPNTIAPDIAEPDQSTPHIDVDALLQIKKMRTQLTSQQYKTLRSQVLAGDADGAIKGLRRLVKEQNNATDT